MHSLSHRICSFRGLKSETLQLSLKSMWEAAPGFVPEPIAVGTDEDTGRTFYWCAQHSVLVP